MSVIFVWDWNDILNRPSIFEWFLYDAQWFSQIFTDCHWLSRDFQWFIFVRVAKMQEQFKVNFETNHANELAKEIRDVYCQLSTTKKNQAIILSQTNGLLAASAIDLPVYSRIQLHRLQALQVWHLTGVLSLLWNWTCCWLVEWCNKQDYEKIISSKRFKQNKR